MPVLRTLVVVVLALPALAAAGGAAEAPGSETARACTPDELLFCLAGQVDVALACEPAGSEALVCAADITWTATGGSGLPAAPRGEVTRFAEAELTVCYPGGLCMSTISTLVGASCAFGPEKATCATVTQERFETLPIHLQPGECAEVEAEGILGAELYLTPRALTLGDPLLTVGVAPAEAITACV